MSPNEYVKKCEAQGLDFGPVQKAKRSTRQATKDYFEAAKQVGKDVLSTVVAPANKAIEAFDKKHPNPVKPIPEAVPVPDTVAPKGLPVAQRVRSASDLHETRKPKPKVAQYVHPTRKPVRKAAGEGLGSEPAKLVDAYSHSTDPNFHVKVLADSLDDTGHPAANTLRDPEQLWPAYADWHYNKHYGTAAQRQHFDQGFATQGGRLTSEEVAQNISAGSARRMKTIHNEGRTSPLFEAFLRDTLGYPEAQPDPLPPPKKRLQPGSPLHRYKQNRDWAEGTRFQRDGQVVRKGRKPYGDEAPKVLPVHPQHEQLIDSYVNSGDSTPILALRDSLHETGHPAAEVFDHPTAMGVFMDKNYGDYDEGLSDGGSPKWQRRWDKIMGRGDDPYNPSREARRDWAGGIWKALQEPHGLLPKGPPVRKAAMVAVSPSTETHDFSQAQSSLTSQNQQQLRGIAKTLFKQLGIDKGQLLNAIGDTAAWGAEPSVAGRIDQDIDPARLKYLAAWLGNRYNQKNVLTFMGHSGGKDLLHDLTVGDSNLERIRQSLTKHGIEYRTLVPDRNQTRILVYDESGKLANNVKTFAETNRAQIHSTPGTGEFVGDPAWTSRPVARNHYRKIIGDFEQAAGGGNDPSGPPSQPATNSPSGGSVIRGQYYPGGQRLPNPY